MIRFGTIDEIQEVIKCIPEFVNPYPREEFQKRLSRSNSLILIAEEKGKAVGFKCGYQKSCSVFYSWMGGVIPEYRRKGTAAELLKEMENWSRFKKFSKLKFKTMNEHKAMLLFSIKHGFDIIDVEKSNKDPRLRIWLSKEL